MFWHENRVFDFIAYTISNNIEKDDEPRRNIGELINPQSLQKFQVNSFKQYVCPEKDYENVKSNMWMKFTIQYHNSKDTSVKQKINEQQKPGQHE